MATTATTNKQPSFLFLKKSIYSEEPIKQKKTSKTNLKNMQLLLPQQQEKPTPVP